MLDATVTAGALAHLGYRITVIPPPVILDDVLTIECGATVIWGTVASQALILRDDPSVAYSAKP